MYGLFLILMWVLFSIIALVMFEYIGAQFAQASLMHVIDAAASTSTH